MEPSQVPSLAAVKREEAERGAGKGKRVRGEEEILGKPPPSSPKQVYEQQVEERPERPRSSVLLDKDFLCPICMQRLKDAFLTSCGHSFCYACITTHLSNRRNCPCCGHFLTQEQLFPNFLLNKLLHKAAACQLVSSSSPAEQLSLALKQGAEVSVQELDSLLTMLGEKKRKAEQEEAEVNMELLLDFLQRSCDQKQAELDQHRSDLRFLAEDIASLQGRRGTGSGSRDKDPSPSRTLSGGCRGLLPASSPGGGPDALGLRESLEGGSAADRGEPIQRLHRGGGNSRRGGGGGGEGGGAGGGGESSEPAFNPAALAAAAQAAALAARGGAYYSATPSGFSGSGFSAPAAPPPQYSAASMPYRANTGFSAPLGTNVQGFSSSSLSSGAAAPPWAGPQGTGGGMALPPPPSTSQRAPSGFSDSPAGTSSFGERDASGGGGAREREMASSGRYERREREDEKYSDRARDGERERERERAGGEDRGSRGSDREERSERRKGDGEEPRERRRRPSGWDR
eukprot:TRINITY_DN5440_c1_g2_i1.p1 TRINITY_DN5440_c1_g2~~TRINITY_DN5440_c1_g2_i1.p1  ORF type:complete len:514 (-),score=122.78 TRINITY_DN5440_c1_g2_i1:237-1778(-)